MVDQGPDLLAAFAGLRVCVSVSPCTSTCSQQFSGASGTSQASRFSACHLCFASTAWTVLPPIHVIAMYVVG